MSYLFRPSFRSLFLCFGEIPYFFPSLKRLSLSGSQPTGHCIDLVVGSERTLAANLGAAMTFDLGDYASLNLERDLMRTDLVYTTGFFASHSWDVVKAAMAFKNKATGGLDGRRRGRRGRRMLVAFNLSGEYICR